MRRQSSDLFTGMVCCAFDDLAHFCPGVPDALLVSILRSHLEHDGGTDAECNRTCLLSSSSTHQPILAPQ